MKKILLGALPFLCMFFIITFIHKAKPIQHMREHAITAQHGLLTLPAHGDRDIFSIKGQWHFTPNQFYYFRDNTRPLYAPLPGRLSETSLKTEFGYASYGLRIVGLNPNKVYVLQLNHILSSCTIVINGIDRAGQGQPGVSAQTEIPGKTISMASFKPLKNGTADIVVNISNFHNRYGGTDQSIILGSADILNESFVFNLLFYNITATVLLLFSMFFIMLYLNYKKMPYILWFAFAAITISIRISVFYPHILAYIWLTMPWKFYFILRYSSMPLAALFFTIFINKIFNIQYVWIYRSIIAICLSSTAFIAIAPTLLVSRYLYMQQTLIFIAAIYDAIIIIRALFKRKKSAVWIAMVLGILAGFALYDTLVSQWVISGKLLLQEGAIISIIIAVIMSIDNYATSIHQIEQLVEEQKRIQNALRRFFPNQLLMFLQKNNITEINTGDSSELSMTVLSIDIRSFTSMSEQLEPDEVFILLNKYFALVAPIIRKYGGVIMKFLGDGFTALFSKNPDAAVACGIEIQKKLQEENIRLGNLPAIRAGIGIDTGKILLGVIGNDSRLDSVVISNTCYTAEELQAATKVYSNTIIISESIFKSLQYPENFHIRCIQESPVIDTAEQTVIYEVYDCDAPDTQDKKQKTASYIEKALKKIKEKNYATAQTYIAKSLEIFPEDPLALHYQKVIRETIYNL
ncbi:guanylate cyclase [Treponema sp. OMZ 838]|uniref:adenylate/guanylate cyclase domain-containing protein n=1 Tax=Treponema sp. OMZ 838 TaxID=1539298 RepID=UPI00053010FD|nr:adenylate/guanylate cyclase domain-containing protein [Treponema sp. OMZ 838]AIW90414.1 guanylate cyclase [Treponema sp. OMZ 838]